MKTEPKKPIRNPNPVPIPPNYEEVPANRRKPGPASRDTVTKSVIDPITKKIKFLCDYCGKTFGKRWDVERHRRYIHTGERPYSCDVCGKAFAEPGALAKHKRRHLGQFSSFIPNPKKFTVFFSKIFEIYHASAAQAKEN